MNKWLLALCACLIPILAHTGLITSQSGRFAAASGGGGDAWLLPAGHYIDAKMVMTPVAPRPGLTTSNIYYIAHPQVPYILPVGVLGGARPLHYELTTAPTGMTIDAATGVMTWSSPTTTGSPHNVVAEVCDQEHTRVGDSCITVSWTITVQTSGFVFIATDGNDANPGTISQPKQTAAAIEASSTTDIIVLRNGMDIVWTEALCDDARRIMAYPGETATLDFTVEQCDGIGDIATNRAFVNLTLIPKDSSDGGTAIIDWPSGPTDILVYNNIITDAGGTCSIGSNPALFYSGNASPAWTQYIAFIGNDFQGTGCNDIFLGYSTQYLLAEDNTLANNAFHGWSAKIRNQYWSIVENTGLTGNTAEIFNASDYDITDSIEIAWNNYATTTNGMLYELGNGSTETGPTNIWSYRNTWQMAYHHVNWDPVGVTVQNDVVEYTNASGDPHGWFWENTADSGTYSGEECVGRGVDIVNAAGILQGAYSTTCLGIRGHVAQ